MKPYLEVENLVRQLFVLAKANKNDSQEAKDIRARLLELDTKISSKNQERIMALGIKLYRSSKK